MITDTAPHIILASASPRRKYLLEQAGVRFTVVPSSFDEESVPPCAPGRYVTILAREKALAVSRFHPGSWVLGADTVVAIGDATLGKPDSDEAARKMLSRLSGKTHQVYTGYAISCLSEDRMICGCEKTDVLFKTLTPDEIDWYIGTREPFDKAGAYAIQGIGTFLVKRINGSYTNVVGLPVCEILEALIKENLLQRVPVRSAS